MTSDGTNSYKWDAENRLIEIDYPGSGNKTSIVYDGLGHWVSIVETTGGATTSTKQFVFCSGGPCEQRDASGTVTAQFFDLGETISGSDYFFNPDLIGSTRQVTNSSGSLVSDRSYDPFGRVTISSESVTPDFGFAGMYQHSRSGLSLAFHRAYSPGLGRWINRDPIAERGGTNLFAYVTNDPIALTDEQGLSGPWHPPAGVHMSCTNSDTCPQLQGKMFLLMKAINSHTGWDLNNPGQGGRHNQEIADFWRAYANCQALYDAKCLSCPAKPSQQNQNQNQNQQSNNPQPGTQPFIIVPIPIPGTPWSWPGVQGPGGVTLPLIPIPVPGGLVLA
jgi:RHS repeat-associated protein